MSKKLLRVFIPAIIFVVIIAIWFVKNQSKPQPKSTTIDGVDYSLVITSLDIDEILSHKKPVIIDFGADACDPCRAMYPELVAINEEMAGKALIKFIDVWKYPEAVSNMPIQLIPTQMFFDSTGKPYVPKADLGIEFTMYSHKDTNEHIYTVHQGQLTKEQMRTILQDMGVRDD